ncbi:hypothetical protein FKM82_006234 [Ascaphus truei]
MRAHPLGRLLSVHRAVPHGYGSQEGNPAQAVLPLRIVLDWRYMQKQDLPPFGVTSGSRADPVSVEDLSLMTFCLWALVSRVSIFTPPGAKHQSH